MRTTYEKHRGSLFNYRIVLFGNILAWLIHFSFLLIFWGMDVSTLAWSNALSVLYYTFSFYFVHKRYYLLFFTGLFLEVIYNAVISTIVLGWGANIHYFIIMIAYAVFFMPNVSRTFRVISTLLSMLIYSFLYLNVTTGTQPLDPTYERVVGLVCLLLTIGVIAGLSFIFEGAVVEVTSKLEKTNEQLHVLASRDGLTGLYNRMTGYQRIQDEIHEAVSLREPYAVSLADIDHFKAFNELHGHDCGDMVLKQVALSLDQVEGICVRWGGEEFLLFLRNMSPDEVAKTLDELRERIESTKILYNGSTLSVTMTFGVSCGHEIEDVETLVKNADDLLRHGKQSGKNQVVTSII